jgi:hypothetical protein
VVDAWSPEIESVKEPTPKEPVEVVAEVRLPLESP